ncbi:MAG: hypothetical protein U1E56_04100 [Bauldia sp.]
MGITQANEINGNARLTEHGLPIEDQRPLAPLANPFGGPTQRAIVVQRPSQQHAESSRRKAISGLPADQGVRASSARPLEPDIEALIEAAASVTDLAAASRLLWLGSGAGRIDDDSATRLNDLVIAKQRRWSGVAHRTMEAVTRRFILKRRYPASPDRLRSRARRRQLAASGPMPPALAALFTTGELAVLKIIADEHRGQGHSAPPIDAIAARAGVCRSTVCNAQRAARVAGLIEVVVRPQRGRKNLTNLITIVSAGLESLALSSVDRAQ